MAISKLTCIYSALILYDDDVTVMEDKINAHITAAGVNVEPFWPVLFAKALSNVNIASLICNVGVSGPAPTAGGAAPAGGVSPASSAAPAEVKKKEEAEKEESEESNDDMGFGLFD
ncbi:large ribosomal subunit protein P1-like isoform X1 [Phascolarctos cinereus]|uniref:Large ribosomal subunit protein P1 n=1 Tax=Phascolarctos cinereus TaxID=38626 RepID=A0A6P5KSE3_PHACI|nr:60S acidic ribosomal protein P1-like isoform X1 [Phascolarctos cinereus]